MKPISSFLKVEINIKISGIIIKISEINIVFSPFRSTLRARTSPRPKRRGGKRPRRRTKIQPARQNPTKNNHFTGTFSGSEEGFYVRIIDSYITQL